jgi:hypothetical protein
MYGTHDNKYSLQFTSRLSKPIVRNADYITKFALYFGFFRAISVKNIAGQVKERFG